jgi:MoaA/NifB/PqqE/SkfB family radical SAM enzyme
VRQAAQLGVLVFNLEGANEPVAVPELAFPVIDEIKAVGMYGILTTNGTLWKARDVKRLVELGWDRIHFSLDSHRAEIHDGLRGMRGAFRRAVKTIRLLNEWKARLGSARPMLNVNIVINRLNFRQLPELVKLCHKLKADYIFVEPLIVFSPTGQQLKLSSEQVERELPLHVRRAKELADLYEIDNNFATQDENLRPELVESTSAMQPVLMGDVRSFQPGTLLASPCFKPWSRLAIKYDGLAGHCGLIQEGEQVKKRGLKEIWYGGWLEGVRRRMMAGQLLPHCSHCIPSDVTQRRRFRRRLIEALRVGG